MWVLGMLITAFLILLVLSAGYLWRTFGAALPPLSLVRVGAAYAAALAAGWAWPISSSPW